MYKKARLGEIKNFTGVDGEFELSESNDIVLNTDVYDTSFCINQIIDFLIDKKIIEKSTIK